MRSSLTTRRRARNGRVLSGCNRRTQARTRKTGAVSAFQRQDGSPKQASTRREHPTVRSLGRTGGLVSSQPLVCPFTKGTRGTRTTGGKQKTDPALALEHGGLVSVFGAEASAVADLRTDVRRRDRTLHRPPGECDFLPRPLRLTWLGGLSSERRWVSDPSLTAKRRNSSRRTVSRRRTSARGSSAGRHLSTHM